MAFDYLSPNSFQPQDDSAALDPVEMYKKKVLGARWRQPARPGGSALGRPPAGGGQMSGANAAEQRAFYGQLDNSALRQPPQQPVVQQPDPARYFSPSPEEYIGTNEPTPAEATPNRGGFNQADGIARPDYSRGDELRKQANDLQHPSWWKKLVNGDEGLAYQAEHKYRLAQYEDLAANNKFRFDHPEAFKDQTPKLQPVRAGEGLWDANKNAWAVEPQDKQGSWHDTFEQGTGRRIWANPETGKTRPFMVKNPQAESILSKDDPNIPEEVQDVKPAAPKKGKPYSKLFDHTNDEGETTVGLQDDEGNIIEKRFGGTAKKTQPKGGAAGGAKKEWTPQALAAEATRIANIRRKAEESMDPKQIDAAGQRVRSILASGGLEEDEETGGLRPVAAGSTPKQKFDPANPPRGTIRTDRKSGQKEIFLRGSWQPFTGTKGGKK